MATADLGSIVDMHFEMAAFLVSNLDHTCHTIFEATFGHMEVSTMIRGLPKALSKAARMVEA